MFIFVLKGTIIDTQTTKKCLSEANVARKSVSIGCSLAIDAYLNISFNIKAETRYFLTIFKSVVRGLMLFFIIRKRFKT